MAFQIPFTYGGATILEEESSYPGWDGGGAVITGTSAVVLNNAADILANSKLLIHWSNNSAVTSYTSYRQNLFLQQFKNAGIEQILIDPLLNETGMLYCDQWIPISRNRRSSHGSNRLRLDNQQSSQSELLVNSHRWLPTIQQLHNRSV